MKHQGYVSAMLDFKFEAAHRQPEVGGKCFNLHGHSWRVTVTVCNNVHVGGVNEKGLSVEFSEVKACIRRWINHYFDHGTLLGTTDVLVQPLLDEGCKVFLFGELPHKHALTGDNYYEALPWPSVEAVAFCLGERLSDVVKAEVGDYVSVEAVMVTETDSNSISWTSPFGARPYSVALENPMPEWAQGDDR